MSPAKRSSGMATVPTMLETIGGRGDSLPAQEVLLSNTDVFTSPLDPGITESASVLRAAGPCEGGPGHALPDPTVLFHGDRSAGWHALGGLRRSDFRS